MATTQIVQCLLCKKFFSKNVSQIKLYPRHFCSANCRDQYRVSLRERDNCLSCGKEIIRPMCHMRGSVNHFCSRSCAAKYNNVTKPKKVKTKTCKVCGKFIYVNRTYCPECIVKPRINPETPIGDLFYEKRRSARYAKIRNYAKSITKTWEQKCIQCGYVKHVETCHKQPISTFDPKTPVGVVNCPDNLILLCSNCHWELDHGLLKVNFSGSEGI